MTDSVAQQPLLSEQVRDLVADVAGLEGEIERLEMELGQVQVELVDAEASAERAELADTYCAAAHQLHELVHAGAWKTCTDEPCRWLLAGDRPLGPPARLGPGARV